MKNRLFYLLKPYIPRSLQLRIRRELIQYRWKSTRDVWPIHEESGEAPSFWTGWPDKKKFALVLTHDVEKIGGHDKCIDLMNVELQAGFRSSFNFVPERYDVSPVLRRELRRQGFEVGVHGLNHDGRLYESRQLFEERAQRINQYLLDWGCMGFRSPAMHHNLDWIHSLNVAYDSSTFDTDPFEPQSDGVHTIFPFWVSSPDGNGGYVELPYTLPQDFTLFVLMGEEGPKTWKQKLNWIAEKGGMALLNVHPDYINFGGGPAGPEEFPVNYYSEFLEFIKSEYEGRYWNPVPGEMAHFWLDVCLPADTKPLAA